MKHIFLSLLIGLGAIALSGCGSTEAGVCPITGARGPRPTATQTGDKAAKAKCCKEKQSEKKPACCSEQPATSESTVPPAAAPAVESTSSTLPACCKSAA